MRKLNTDTVLLERYVAGFFLRAGRTEWPTVSFAARSLRWTRKRIEEAIDDSELLDTQSYFCDPPEPYGAHEIYSYADLSPATPEQTIQGS